jgi:glutaredoxin 3
MTQKNLVLFRLEGCPYCKKAEEALDAKGVKYKKIEVPPEKSERKILMEVSGQDSVPVLVDVVGSKDQDDDILEWLETQ